MIAPAQSLVIVGSGLAAWTVVRELRKLDAHTPITLVTRDNGDFYSKPMLSNALSSGKTAAQLVSTTSAAMAEQYGVKLMAHTEVSAIDPTAATVHTNQGPLTYSRLVLALGADPVRLPLQGDAADRVLSVNDLQDYAAFRERLLGARRVTVIGAGLIGCEYANDLIAAGYEVDVVDPGSQPLGRLLPPEAGDLLQRALSDAGVRFHWGTSVQAVHAQPGDLQLELTNGQRLGTDVVLSAVGLRPRTALAQAAGLQTARGIVVNRQLQTSQPDIYALGDVAEVEGHCLPYVMPLMQAARTLAADLAGQPASLRYPAMPVVVKTPALPIVVSPPAPGAAGQWQIEARTDGVDARFVGNDGTLLGFALAGKATTNKTALQKTLPALLA
jgi:rubredoxin-NAD+ reductase